MLDADEVLCVLDLLRQAGAEVRVHRQEQEPAVVAALAAAGFVERLDLRPVRFVVAAPTAWSDRHPLLSGTRKDDGAPGPGGAWGRRTAQL